MPVTYDADVAYDAELNYDSRTNLSTEVPGAYQVGLHGLAFLVDDRPGRGIKRRSVPFLRNQADTGSRPGAHSLSPAGQWRSYQEDWSHGAGQSHRDRENSDPARFRSSKGAYVWDRWKLSMLADTVQKRSTANNNLFLVPAGAYLYLADGDEVYHTTTLAGTPTWTAANIAAGEASTSVQAMTTNGATVYAGSLTTGIHQTTVGATTSTHYSDLNVGHLAYVAGRLMASNNASLYNVTAGGAAPAALYTHPNANFRWVTWAEGLTHIYAGGHDSNNFSAIYKITIQPDGTALTTPTLAVPPLPKGERVLRMLGYGGFIVIATNQGIRLASVDSNGNLTLGSPIPVPGLASAVGAGLEAAERFVWFTWPSYDGTSGGLGRLDLSSFTGTLTPAYASDLMVTTTAQPFDIATFESKRVLSVRGLGVYTESANKVATATLDSGDISYGITDDKVATALDVSHDALQGSHQAWLSVNGGVFSTLGTHTEGGLEGLFSIPESKGERFEIRHTLSPDGAGTAGPTLTRTTLSAFPVPQRPSEVFEVWLLLHTAEALDSGATASRDPLTLLNDIIALERNGTVIDFQLGAQGYRALIEDHEFVSEGQPLGSWPEGSVGLTVRAI